MPPLFQNLYGTRQRRHLHQCVQNIRIAEDTCSGYNLIRRECLTPDWDRYVDPKATLPRLAGADHHPLRLTALVHLAVRLANKVYRLPFVVVDSLAVEVLIGTAFIDRHVRNIAIDKQRLNLMRGGSVAIIEAKGVENSRLNDTPKSSRQVQSDCGSRETDVHPIRL